MRKHFTEEQIIGFLREAEAGLPIKELCRRHGFSEARVTQSPRLAYSSPNASTCGNMTNENDGHEYQNNQMRSDARSGRSDLEERPSLVRPKQPLYVAEPMSGVG